jgi:MFS family permease
MFDIEVNLTDPSKNSYYIPILVGIATVLLTIQLIIMLLKELKRESGVDMNVSLDKTLQNNMDYSLTLETRKNSLKSRYLVAFVLTRSAMWAKAPYLYTLFMTVHKFSMAEIGILYLVDAVAALIFGPITGQLADKYGRKLFCHCYNFSIIINLLLRMQGSRPLAYLAQVVTGFGAGLICTTFEAWVVSQSEIEFKGLKREAERFRKRLFKNSNVLDAAVSIITSGICAIIYSYMGIYAPFWISIGLSALASIVIGILWEENAPLANNPSNTMEQFKEAIKELKKVNVLCIGLIEGIAMGILNIYLFSWTPILKQSTPGGMNVGFIYTCMVLTMIVGTKSYEVLIVYCNFDYYMSITGCLFIQGALLYLTYYIDNFLARLLFLSLFNGLTGFYNPLNSIVKSNILVDEYRALLMNLFRIPLNMYVIIVLLTLRYMNPFTVAIIAGSLAFIASSIGVYLCIYTCLHPEDNDKKDNYILEIDKPDNYEKPKKNTIFTGEDCD